MSTVNHQQPPSVVRANQRRAEVLVNELVSIQKRLGLSDRLFAKAINDLPIRQQFDLPTFSVRVWTSWRSKNSGNLPKAAACWGAVEMAQALRQHYAKQLNGNGAH